MSKLPVHKLTMAHVQDLRAACSVSEVFDGLRGDLAICELWFKRDREALPDHEAFAVFKRAAARVCERIREG